MGPQAKLPSTLKAARMPICRCSPLKRGDASYNTKTFADSGELVLIESLGDYRGIPLSKVTVTPYLFDESEGLSYFPEMRAHIDADLFVPSMYLREDNRTMIIIYPDELSLGALSLKKFQRELGLKVHLYALSSVGKSSANLTRFLRLQFERFRYQYALLIGHQSNMPTHLVKTLYDSKTPSDLPYFLMGEEGDKVPDVHYGRVIAGENADILRQIEKLREYYQRSWVRFSGVHRYVGIASNEEAGFSDASSLEEMTDGIDSLGLEVQKLFQFEEHTTASRILQELDTGAMWFSYLGHSTGRSWKSLHKGHFHSAGIKKMRPSGVKPIVIDISCRSGRFKYGKGNIGETFMNAQNQGLPVGALAYYGSSVDTTWVPPALMGIAIHHVLKERSQKTLFGAILAGQLQLLASYYSLEAAFDNLIWFNLFGDPSLELHF